MKLLDIFKFYYGRERKLRSEGFNRDGYRNLGAWEKKRDSRARRTSEKDAIKFAEFYAVWAYPVDLLRKGIGNRRKLF